jgi:hypothetical protein
VTAAGFSQNRPESGTGLSEYGDIRYLCLISMTRFCLNWSKFGTNGQISATFTGIWLVRPEFGCIVPYFDKFSWDSAQMAKFRPPSLKSSQPRFWQNWLKSDHCRRISAFITGTQQQ